MRKLLSSNRGFTLVELTIVMVIIVILTGIAVVAFTGLIDDVRREAVRAEARSILTAAQSVASKAFAESGYPGNGADAIIVSQDEVEVFLGRMLKVGTDFEAKSDPKDSSNAGVGGALTDFKYEDGGIEVILIPSTGELEFADEVVNAPPSGTE